MKTTKTGKSQPFPEMRSSLNQIIFPAWSEIKLDGEYTVMKKPLNGKSQLINKKGLLREDCEATRLIDEALGKRDAVMIGELYHGEGKAGALYDLLKNQKDDGLRFHPFDIMSIEGTDVSKQPFAVRLQILSEYITPLGVRVESKDEVITAFNEAVELGFEGTVIKNFNEPLIFGPCGWVKMKKKDRNDYPVSKIDRVRERIEVLVPYSSGSETTTKTCGVKVASPIKSTLKEGDVVTIEHQGVLSGGGLRHPVFIEKRES